MARVLAISSLVARGHIGLSAIVPALQFLGHETVALPTVVLSNHPGHPHSAGFTTDCAQLRNMIAALEANGWLEDIDTIITGYLPTTQHVALARSTVLKLRPKRRDAKFICDPVLGDDPGGLYVDPAVALAIKSTLVPLADVLTPNRFELDYLSGCQVTGPAAAVRASELMTAGCVVTTSVPVGNRRMANVCAAGNEHAMCVSETQDLVPKGTGDLFTGLFAGHLLRTGQPLVSLAVSSGQLEKAIQLSIGYDELRLTAALADWNGIAPSRLEPADGKPF